MQETNGPVSSWENVQSSLEEGITAKIPLANTTNSIQQTNGIARVIQPIASQSPAKSANKRNTKREAQEAQDVHSIKERCKRLGISLFIQHATPIRSLGFTSAIQGEGKTFLATIMALALAEDSNEPITLLECNWEQPQFYNIFGCQGRPGLAELIRGECSEKDARFQVNSRLSVIPAGEVRQDGIRLLRQIQKEGLGNIFEPQHANDLFILDLPAVSTSAYGALAASLADALIIVVRAGITPASEVEAAYLQLKSMPVHGIVLNEIKSKIPHLLRQLI